MTTKLADEGFAARFARPENRSMAEVLKNLGVVGAGMFGVGAGVRGLQGLGDLVEGTTGDPPKVPLRRQFIDVPIARRRPREEEGPLRALAKQALEGPAGAGTTIAGRVLDAFGAFNKNMGPATKAVVNPMAREWHQHPWAVPAGLALAGGGLLAGHALADRAIGGAQANEDDSELAEAKRRYEHALGGKLAGAALRCPGCGHEAEAEEGESCPSCRLAKMAAHDPYAGLDRAWDVLEKQASQFLDDLSGPLGAAGTAMGATGLISGLMAYKYVRDRDPAKAVDRALKERRERIFADGPPALVAVPREAGEEPAGVDLGSIRRRIDSFRAPKAAGLPPAAVAGRTLAQLGTQAEQTRLRARAALGIKEETAKPAAPAEPTPYSPPTLAKPAG